MESVDALSHHAAALVEPEVEAILGVKRQLAGRVKRGEFPVTSGSSLNAFNVANFLQQAAAHWTR